MKKLTLIVLLFLALFANLGCDKSEKAKGKGKSSGKDRAAEKSRGKQDPVALASAMLQKMGVDPSSLTARGGDMLIDYETSKATNFDTQVLADWGAIFGALSHFAEREIIITNTVNGEPIVSVSARVMDIRDLSRGVIDQEEFFSRTTIKSIAK